MLQLYTGLAKQAAGSPVQLPETRRLEMTDPAGYRPDSGLVDAVAGCPWTGVPSRESVATIARSP